MPLPFVECYRLGATKLPRNRITTKQIRAVDRLRAGENGGVLTIVQACKAVGISPAIYYRHKQREQRFPALQRDWEELTATFQPILPEAAQERLSPAQRDDLCYAVGGAFRRVYSKPAPLWTARQRASGLRSFATQLSNLVRIYGNLPPDMRDHARTAARVAGADDDLELDEAMVLLKSVAGGFEHALQKLNDIEGAVPRAKGGRKFDSRPRQIAGQLASFFAMAVGEEPTAWQNPGGTPGGAFNTFALGAFKHFLGSDMSDDYAVSEALRFVARHIDHSAEAAGREGTLG